MPVPQGHFEVELPYGVDFGDGSVQRAVQLRKMTGMEEALLYDPSLNAASLVSRLLHQCVLRVGEREALEEAFTTRLTSADRGYLLLELRRITLGDRLQAVYTCPACQQQVQVVEDLSHLTVRRFSDEERERRLEVELEDGWEDRAGQVHRRAVLRLPTGADEEWVARTAADDPLRARDALLVRCLEAFGTLTRAQLESFGYRVLQELTLGDRRRLTAALEGGSPGLDFQRRVRCAHCQREFRTLLDAAAFFELG